MRYARLEQLEAAAGKGVRDWDYEIDPSTRTWILWVYDGDLKTAVVNAKYNHRAKPGIEEYARFIKDACNNWEWVLSHGPSMTEIASKV